MWSTCRRCRNGGTERCEQFGRSQIRQETPIGSKCDLSPRSRPSEYTNWSANAALAAERDRVAAAIGFEAADAFDDLRRDAQIFDAVGGLRELPDDASRRLEGLMDVPQRAGAAVARELEFRRAVALGDVAGAVDAREKHRHALVAGALQRRQPVRDLLEAGVKARRQQFEIVAQLLRRRC